MTTRVAIDRRVRVRGDQAYAGFEDFDGVPVPGAPVEVCDRETGLAGPGQVAEVDTEREQVSLAVDWSQLSAPVPYVEPPSWLLRLFSLLDPAVMAVGRAAEVFGFSTSQPHSRDLAAELLGEAGEAATDAGYEPESQA
jgi:hypothetical protein